eukprot:CAMPEP_0113504580 /NCGR_PEP_ID=MMETSP0014_2-20120614/34792_1 /TAXON_ID=2857 /ORGANISM="Nitzschia sp." /LENGTH=124 /DNA_ID=CAMNT_0000399701 /DNA_START=412 /DNA_END=783 /DNA_ORIENTATION=- /assembly_acc=CAM_ASM_000159
MKIALLVFAAAASSAGLDNNDDSQHGSLQKFGIPTNADVPDVLPSADASQIAHSGPAVTALWVGASSSGLVLLVTPGVVGSITSTRLRPPIGNDVGKVVSIGRTTPSHKDSLTLSSLPHTLSIA